MFNFSRTRYRQLKETYGYHYILLQDDFDVFWTYDDDARELASWLDKSVMFNAKGEAVLKLDEDTLDNYIWDEIEGEEGAFYIHTEDESVPEEETNAEEISLPSSALLKVEILSNQGKQTIIIVSDHKQQDTDNGIYWEHRGLSQAIMKAVATNSDFFLFAGQEYLVESVYRSPEYDILLTRIRHFLDAEIEPQTLFVYQKKTLTADGLEPVTALFYYPESSEPAEMTVFYSPATGEYFVNQEEFNLFRRQHGLPYVALNIAKGEKFSSNPDMAEESILHLYGYNVSSDEGLSDHERQTILARLMDYNIATKGRIENHLEIMIYLGEKNPIMVNAVEKWRRDLLFTNTYKCVDQRKVWISGVKYK